MIEEKETSTKNRGKNTYQKSTAQAEGASTFLHQKPDVIIGKLKNMENAIGKGLAESEKMLNWRSSTPMGSQVCRNNLFYKRRTP